MEQFSYQRHCINFSTVFQETTSNIFIYHIFPIKLLSHICVPCPRSYLAYATLISTFYYYYYYYCNKVHLNYVKCIV